MRKVKSYVLITLTVIAVIVLLSLAGLLVTKLPTTNDPTAIGTLVTGIITALGVVAAVIAGFIAYRQLLEGQKIAYGDFLLRLDEAFQRHQVVHTKLRPGNEWSLIDPDGNERKKVDGPEFPKDGPDVEGYMGVFERVQVLLEKDLIDIGTVNRLYGYRLFNIVNNPTIHQKKLVELGYGWMNFIKLWKALCDLDSNKGKKCPDIRILNHLNKASK